MDEQFNVTSEAPVIINGITIMDHRLRRKMDISCDEYVVLDFIAAWRKSKGNELITAKAMLMKTGLQLNAIVNNRLEWLVEQGFLYKTDAGVLDVTEKWTKHFPSDEDFDNGDENNPGFWQIYGKVGNKAKSKEKYFETRKKVSKELLHKKAVEYVKHCIDTGTYQKYAETWLNPKLEHWNDNVNNKSTPVAQQPAPNVVKGNFYEDKRKG